MAHGFLSANQRTAGRESLTRTMHTYMYVRGSGSYAVAMPAMPTMPTLICMDGSTRAVSCDQGWQVCGGPPPGVADISTYASIYMTYNL